MTTTALVLFMTLPGLALFYAGLVRATNVLSVLGQCFGIACAVSLTWFVIGYTLAFSPGNAFIGGLENIFLKSVQFNSISGDIPESLFLMFQMTFAIITPALIIGAFAERVRFGAVILFSILWIILVYVPITHWVWGGGWLQEMGVLDFAGGLVVHISAGVSALVAAIFIGPRANLQNQARPPHNLPLTVAGAGMLWVGWFGFNGGSALAANGDASMAILVTHLSAATAAGTWILIEWIKFGKPTVLGLVTGMVGGLSAITPASGFVGPAGAVLIGFLAGGCCFCATLLLKKRLKIDDSLDVFPVHGVGGIIGTIAVGVLASPALGILSGKGFADGFTIGSQLSVQFIAVIAVTAYTAIVSIVLLKLTDMLCKLRVSLEEEIEGIDISTHNETGYDLK